MVLGQWVLKSTQIQRNNKSGIYNLLKTTQGISNLKKTTQGISNLTKSTQGIPNLKKLLKQTHAFKQYALILPGLLCKCLKIQRNGCGLGLVSEVPHTIQRWLGNSGWYLCMSWHMHRLKTIG
jgi:hypothetical protein